MNARLAPYSRSGATTDLVKAGPAPGADAGHVRRHLGIDQAAQQVAKLSSDVSKDAIQFFFKFGHRVVSVMPLSTPAT